MTPEETAAHLEVLRAFPTREHPIPKHPAPGCPCHACDGRDRAMEARAEERAAEMRGDYDSEWTRVQADYRREMNDNYWEGS
jgi:hypothetical protein